MIEDVKNAQSLSEKMPERAEQKQDKPENNSDAAEMFFEELYRVWKGKEAKA